MDCFVACGSNSRPKREAANDDNSDNRGDGVAVSVSAIAANAPDAPSKEGMPGELDENRGCKF
jgi:hypothetical protein